jgi:hypothetical protein
MLELLRNIVAVISTFIVISTGTMMSLHFCVFLVNHRWTLSKLQECIVVCIGLIIACLFFPFYYLPC